MADPTQETRRPGRSLKILLAASLALNLGLAGLIVGAVLRARTGEGPHSGSIGHVMRHGDPVERDRARAVLKARGPAFEAGRRARDDARAGVRAAALADPFDAAALSDALTGLRAAEGALAAERHAAFAELAAGLSPQRRAAMIERLELREGRAWRAHHDRRSEGEAGRERDGKGWREGD